MSTFAARRRHRELESRSGLSRFVRLRAPAIHAHLTRHRSVAALPQLEQPDGLGVHCLADGWELGQSESGGGSDYNAEMLDAPQPRLSRGARKVANKECVITGGRSIDKTTRSRRILLLSEIISREKRERCTALH